MNKTKRTWLGILAAAFAALVLAASLVLALPVFARSADAAGGAQTENSVAKISKSGTHYYDSLQEAIDAAEGYAASSSPTITLLKDVTLTEQVTLDVSQIAEGRYIKINGDEYTLSTSSVEQPFRIVGGTGVKADVEVRISDLTMKSTVPQAKLLSVEGGAFTLVLDAVTLDTTGSAQNDRALSVGWESTAGGTVGIEMTDSTIRTSASGYAVMTYNPVVLNIENSSLCGYAALYMYNDVYKNGTGSAGSVVTINGSTITSDNVYNAGSQSDFAAFVFKDNNIKVDIFNSDITANAKGTAHHGIVMFDTSTGSSVYTESTNVTVTGSTVHYIMTAGGSGTLRFGAGTRSNVPFDFDHDDILVSGCTSLQDGAGYVVSATDPAATCGNIGCISLQNAIDTAQEGQAATIVLQKDVAENVTIPAGKEIVLDLNGHSLTAESGTAITNNGTLTIKDGTAAGSGEGYIAGTVSAASKAVYSTGPLTIENGIFCGVYAVDTKCASVNISGGVFKGGSSPAVQFNKSGGSLTIAGGSFTSESTGSGAVYVSAADSVTIKDAAITGSTYGFYSKAKEATIGGNTTIDATNIGAKNLAAIYAIGTKLTLKDNVVIEQLIRLANGTTARIESGTYHAKLTNIATSGAVSNGEFCIVGGTFVSEDITAWFDPAWLIEGEVRYALYSEQDTGEYVVNQYHENDTNVVFIGGYVAQVDGVKYEDLAVALNAANGTTLKLLTNVTDPLTIEATMTLDLGIFGVGTDATTLTVNSGATLTIEGDGYVYGSIENNGNIVLRGGTYNAAEIKIDWVDADRAIAYDSGDELYTVSGDVGVTLTRGGKAYHFSNLYTPFNAGIIQTGETLVLQKDVVGGITLGESRQGHAYTIDMNGHNIEGSFILYAGTLNIVNNGVARANATLSNTQRIFQILPSASYDAKLVLGQNIDLVSGGEAVFIQTPIMTEDITDLDTLQPVAVLHSSANILSQNSFAIVANGTGHGTEIVIDGGSVKTEGGAPAIYHPQYGALTVKGGAVVEGATGIEIRNGILRVEDATIRSTADAFEAVETPDKGGSTVTGAAIAVTKYNNAKVPLKVTIGEATLQAKEEGKALYEGYSDSAEGTLPSGNTVEMKIDGATIEAPVESKNVTEFIESGTFKTQDGTPINVTDYLVDGMAQNTSGTVVPETEKDAVAMIGDTYYNTLQAAVNAVPANADAPTTIVLVGGNADQTITGNGVIVQSGQNIIIDFNGKTYDINNNTVGSSGTETNGFQLLGGSTVVMKNGVIRSDHAKILLQNYCALTLEDMKLSSTVTGCYIVSNNFGSMTVTGDTEIIADSTKGQVAFDVYFGMSANYYGGIEINFTEDFTGKVEGAIEYGRAASASGVEDWQEKASLSIAADDTAVFDVSFEMETGANEENANINIESGTFKKVFAPAFLAKDTALYMNGDKTSFAVAPANETPAEMQKVVAMIDDQVYESLQDAITAAQDNETVTLVANVTEQVTVPQGKTLTLDLHGYKLTYSEEKTLVNKGHLTIVSTGDRGTISGVTTAVYNGENSENEDIPTQLYDITLSLRNVILTSTKSVGAVTLNNNYAKIVSIDGCEIKAPDGMTAISNSGSIEKISDTTIKVEDSSDWIGGPGKAIVLTGHPSCEGSGVVSSVSACDITGDIEVAKSSGGERTGSIVVGSDTTLNKGSEFVCGDGYYVFKNADGNFTAGAEDVVVEAGALAVIGDQAYASLQAAITAAKDGDTVTLLADIVLTETVTIEKDLTLDLGSWTLTAPQNAAALVIEAGDVTIKGAAVQGKSSARAQIVGGAQADRVIVIKTNGTAAIESVSIQLNTTVNKIDEVAVLAAAVEINGAKSVVLNGVVVEMNVVAASGDSSNNVEGILIVNTGEVEIKESVLRVSLTTAASIANAQLQLHGIHAEQTHLTVDTVDITTRCSGRCQDTGIVFYGAMTQDQATAEGASEQYKVLNVINCNIDACIIGISGNGGGTNHGTIMNIVDTKVDYSDRPNGAGVIGTGIYHPQYGILNVFGNDTYIIGGAGIEIRSGELNLAGGTVVGTDPLGHWSGDSGNTVGGAAVAVSQHTTELPITVSITGGTLEATGENGRSVYELDTVESDEPSKGVALLLTGGTYNAPVESKNLTQFIEGGRFKTLPAAKYCSEDFAPVYSNGYFDVIPSTALKEAKADAQADVRAYAVALGLDWSDIQAAAADEGHANHDLASAVMTQYNAIAEAVDTLAVKTSRAAALEKVKEYASALEAAFEAYKKEKIKGEELAAALAGEEGEADDVVLSTSVIAALYEAPTKELFELYYANVLKEIADIRAFREEIAGQTAALKTLDDALEALDDALLGENGALGTLQSEIEDAIAAAQNAITGAAADGTGGMSLKEVYNKLNTTIEEIRSKVAQALSSLQSDLTAVKNGMLNDADLEELLSDIQTKLDTAVTEITGGDGNSIANAVNSIERAFTTLQTGLESKIEAVKTQADTLLTLFAKDSDGYYTMKELAATLATLATPEDLTSIQTTLTAITNAQKEIKDAIAGVKTELTAQTDAIDSALTALTGKVDTLTGSLAAVNSGLTEKIDALQASATALSTALSALASKTDVAAVAADLKAASEQLNAVKASVDSIAVQVSAAAAVEEAKTEGAAEIEAWLNAYLDKILGNETAGLVRAAAYTAETTEGELYARLVESFGEDNAGLVLKYYNEALAAIDAAESVSDVTSAVSTFKAQVASVEAAAGNAPSFTVTYILLAAVLVVALVALLVLLLKRSPAPAPAPASAPASEPASESPAPAAEETAAAEAPSEAEGDVIVLPELEEDQEHVVIAATTRTFDEAYEALDETARSLFDRVKAYALTKEDAAESMQSSGVCVKRGGKLIVKLTVRRGNPVALFRIENDLVKDFRRNAESPVKLKVRATELVLHEEGDLEAAYAMVDLAVEQIERDIENAKERRREARRARRLQNQAAAQTDETDKTDKED